MARARAKYPPFGSVSTDTLDTEELVRAFTGVLQDFEGARGPHRELIAEAGTYLDALVDDEGIEPPDGDELVQELQDALNEISPPYGYFGAHGGDGADFGWWPDHGGIAVMIHDGQAISVKDLADVPKGYTGDVFEVNDHGNMTYYTATRGRLREVWSIV